MAGGSMESGDGTTNATYDSGSSAISGYQIGYDVSGSPLGGLIGAVAGRVLARFGRKKKKRAKKKYKAALEQYRHIQVQARDFQRALERRAIVNQGTAALAQTAVSTAATGAGRGSSGGLGARGSVLTQLSGNLVNTDIGNTFTDSLETAAYNVKDTFAKYSTATLADKIKIAHAGGAFQGISGSASGLFSKDNNTESKTKSNSNSGAKQGAAMASRFAK